MFDTSFQISYCNTDCEYMSGQLNSFSYNELGNCRGHMEGGGIG